MNPTDDLVPVLKKLRLSGVLQSLDVRLRQAADDNLSPIEFLYRLLVDEVERREAKQLHLRLRRAAFDSQKSLDDFDFSFNPGLPKWHGSESRPLSFTGWDSAELVVA